MEKKRAKIILCILVVIALVSGMAVFLPISEAPTVALRLETGETFLKEKETELFVETQKTQNKPVRLWGKLFLRGKYRKIDDPAKLEELLSEKYSVTGAQREQDGKQLYTVTVSGLVQNGELLHEIGKSHREELKQVVGKGADVDQVKITLDVVSTVKFVYARQNESAPWELKAVANRMEADVSYRVYVWQNVTEKSGWYTANCENLVLEGTFDRAEALAAANDSGKVQNDCIGEVTVEVSAPVKCSITMEIPAPKTPGELLP